MKEDLSVMIVTLPKTVEQNRKMVGIKRKRFIVVIMLQYVVIKLVVWPITSHVRLANKVLVKKTIAG